MNRPLSKKNLTQMGILFLGVPIVLYVTGGLPKRMLFKELLSLLTLLSCTVMIGQFFLTRCNPRVGRSSRMTLIATIHKALGYTCIPVLLLHPLFIVVPRSFEAGIGAREAFITLVTTVQSVGVVTGICAWILLFVLGITSLLRKQLFINFRTWRAVHGILSVLLLASASWHVIDLGRHMTPIFSAYLIAGAAVGVLLFIRTSISGWRTNVAKEVVL